MRDQLGADARERRLEVALDVVGQRLQRRDVHDRGFVGKRTCHALTHEVVDRREEGGERLARSGRRRHEDVATRLDCRPRLRLRLRGSGKRLREPGADGGMEQVGRSHAANITMGSSGCKARTGVGTVSLRSIHRDLSRTGWIGASGLDVIERSFDNSINFLASQMDLPPLAFVDVETTGVDPRENRVTEIGVVTVDARSAREWTTVINPLTRRHERPAAPHEITDEMRNDAPRFRDIAADLARRLEGRLLIAHNARFDYSFLKAEFGRVGIDFHADVLCSLMLSRKLYAQFAHHDVDSLIEHHALEAEVRHRALHDARLVWQFWQTIHRELPEAAIENAIELLRVGPLLPAHLHPSLIDRLPEAPGVYVFHGENGEVLLTGTALNLRLRVLNYFRLDTMSGRALAISHRIRNVTWRVTQGTLGAKLRLALTPKESQPARKPQIETVYSWRFAPEAFPCLSLLSLSDRPHLPDDELFGMFESPRKARNALHRIAAARKLCYSLLGIGNGRDARAPAARPNVTGSEEIRPNAAADPAVLYN